MASSSRSGRPEPEPAEEPWNLVVGQVVAPHGVAGEVRVRPETDFPERLGRLGEVCLSLPTGEQRFLRILSARPGPRGILVKFAGCERREQAEALRGALIAIRPSMAAPLPEGAYWVHQVVGLRVVTEQGEDLGEVTEVIRTPANDVYVTPRAMIPAVRQVVREINLEEGRMVVSLLPEEAGE